MTIQELSKKFENKKANIIFVNENNSHDIMMFAKPTFRELIEMIDYILLDFFGSVAFYKIDFVQFHDFFNQYHGLLEFEEERYKIFIEME